MYSGYSEPYEKKEDRKNRQRLAAKLGVDWYGKSVDQMMSEYDSRQTGCTCRPDGDPCPVCAAILENSEIIF